MAQRINTAITLFSCYICVVGQLVSWPPNSSHCPFDLVALHFIASGDFSGCYMDGKKFEGGVIISTIPPDKINITVVFTVDRPNVLRSLNCCVQLDSQSSCSPLVWFSTEGKLMLYSLLCSLLFLHLSASHNVTGYF